MFKITKWFKAFLLAKKTKQLQEIAMFSMFNRIYMKAGLVINIYTIEDNSALKSLVAVISS